jgi:hypothetical protein
VSSSSHRSLSLWCLRLATDIDLRSAGRHYARSYTEILSLCQAHEMNGDDQVGSGDLCKTNLYRG